MLIILFVIVVHEILYAKGPVVTAHTYPYQPNGNGFKGAIPRVTLLALQTTTPDRNADRPPVAARATDETRPQRRTAARVRCVVGIQDGCVFVCQLQRFLNSTASQPSIIYFNNPICDCSTLNMICQGTCCNCTYLPVST